MISQLWNRMRGSRTQKPIKIAIALIVLLVHFFLAVAANLSFDLERRHIYPGDFSASLSLAAGHGLCNPDIDTDRGGKSIQEFLNLERNDLSEADWQAAKDSIRPTARPLDQQKASRIVELYVVGTIWRIFGPSWSLIAIFYAFVSTCACGLIMIFARRASGSDWAALVAGTFLALSPFELYLGSWSFRDTNPLWFWCLTMGSAAVLIHPFPSLARSLGAGFLAGGIATIGYGWRIDSLLIAPFLIAIVFLWAWKDRRSWWFPFAMVASVTLGITIMFCSIRILKGWDQAPPSTGFHIAYYADATRSSLLGIENSSQIPRHDGMVGTHVCARYGLTRQSDDMGFPEYLGGVYGLECRSLYGDRIGPQLSAMAAYLPTYICETSRHITNPNNAPFTLGTQSKKKAHSLSAIAAALQPALLTLAVLGAIAFWFFAQDRILAGCTLVVIPAYHLFLLAILPESKHYAVCLLPLALCIGFGVQATLSLFKPRVLLQVLRSRYRGFIAVLLAVACSYFACVIAFRQISTAARSNLLATISSCRQPLQDVSGSRIDTRTIRLDSTGSKEESITRRSILRGFEVQVENPLQHPGIITVYHRVITNSGHITFACQHPAIAAGTTPLFLTLLGHALPGILDHQCLIVADSGMTIAGAKEVDISRWRQGPIETVLANQWAGSPILPTTGHATTFTNAWVTVAGRDFPPEALTGDPELAFTRINLDLLPNPDHTSCSVRPSGPGRTAMPCQPAECWSPVEGCQASLDSQGRLELTTNPPENSYTATSKTIQIPIHGDYIFRIPLMTPSGKIDIGVQDHQGIAWLAASSSIVPLDPVSAIVQLRANLPAGGVRLVAYNSGRDGSSRCTLAGIEVSLLIPRDAGDAGTEDVIRRLSTSTGSSKTPTAPAATDPESRFDSKPWSEALGPHGDLPIANLVPATPGTTWTLVNGQISLVSEEAAGVYICVSPVIEIGKSWIANIEVAAKVEQGRLELGCMSADGSTWIVYGAKRFLSPEGTLFRIAVEGARSRAFRLVLTNQSEKGRVRAQISSIRIEGTPQQGQPPSAP